MLSGSALLAGCAAGTLRVPPAAFVRREGQGFTIGGEPYRFAGTNMWYAAYLGADTAYLGDPPHEPQGWYGAFDTDRKRTR
jgi:mannan endo-1,4-beta-mannosidase